MTGTAVAVLQPNTKLIEARDNLPKELVPTYNEWCSLEGQAIQGVLDIARAQGKLIQDLTQDTTTYNAGSVVALAEALGENPDLLYKRLAFVEKYTDKEYEALKAAESKFGRKLTLSHVFVLLTVADKKERYKWQRMALANHWTAKVLQSHLVSETGNKNPNAGRPLAQPKNLDDGALNAQSCMAELTRRSEQVWEPMFSQFAEAPPDSVTLKTRTNLLKMVESGESALAACKRQVELAKRALKRTETVLKKKGILQDGDDADAEGGEASGEAA